MKGPWHATTLRWLAGGLVLLLLASAVLRPAPVTMGAELSEELKAVPHKIIYETWHEDNWELLIAGADGSRPVNFTRTPQVHELYPRVSPDGTKVCFVCDEGEGASKIVPSARMTRARLIRTFSRSGSK